MLRGDPVIPLCLLSFPVASLVTYLRRFQPSSQPLVKFPASSNQVFVKKGNYLVLDYSLIYYLGFPGQKCVSKICLWPIFLIAF